MGVSMTTIGLDVRYGERLALSGLDMKVEGPATVAVIGPNGSGKSTLLGAIAGLVAPSAGSVTVESTSAPAFVLQSTEVDRSLPITARDTVGLARYPRLGLLRRFDQSDRTAVSEAMRRLSIAELADRQLHEMSGGQRQRVLVAQGIAQESDILLLDEPVTGLDMTSRTLILDVVDEERAAGRLVVMTTHNLDDARRCDLVLLLNTTCVAFGRPDEVLTDRCLREAFGGRFLRMGDEVYLDDPHHHHSSDPSDPRHHRH